MLHLTILNLQSTVFDGDVKSITIPALKGELTILPNHLPIITRLKRGSISVLTSAGERYESAERKYFECAGGILEFSENKATVLL